MAGSATRQQWGYPCLEPIGSTAPAWVEPQGPWYRSRSGPCHLWPCRCPETRGQASPQGLCPTCRAGEQWQWRSSCAGVVCSGWGEAGTAGVAPIKVLLGSAAPTPPPPDAESSRQCCSESEADFTSVLSTGKCPGRVRRSTGSCRSVGCPAARAPARLTWGCC